MSSDSYDWRPIDILLVEDNPGDVDLTREALQGAKVSNRLHVAEDGEQALDFLFRKGHFADAPRPDLILLDLNLPKRESQADEDVARAYRLHANCYIAKPVSFTKFLRVIEAIENFWLTVVKLPKKRSE
jgi:two-component system, chemotaxis family, response regulator Rcp1